MKKCVSCNYMADDGARFCAQCGGNQFTESGKEPVSAAAVVPEEASAPAEPASADPVIPASQQAPAESAASAPAEHAVPASVQPVVPAPAPSPADPSAQPAAAPKDSVWGKLLSFLLCVIVTILALGLSVLFLVRSSLFDSSLDLILKTLGKDVTKVKVGALIGESNDMTLSEYVSKLGFASALQIEEEDVEELLQEKFIREFAVEKVSDYISDILHENGDGKVKASEITDLLADNEDSVEDAIGFPLNDLTLILLENRLESRGWLEDLELSQYRDQHEEVFALISFLLSTLLMGVVGAMIILLLLSILLLRKDKAAACSNVAGVAVNLGCWNLIIVVATFFVPGILNRLFGLGEKFYSAVCMPFRLYGVLAAASAIAFGIVFVLFARLIRFIRKRKQLKKLKISN